MLTALAALPLAASWTLVAGGDVMLYHVSPKKSPFLAVEALFRKADVAYANLEIPLTSAKKPTARKTAAELKAKQQFILKADPAHIKHLVSLGLDLVSLGNNHAMDYRAEGLAQMTRLLDRSGIGWTGAGTNRARAHQVVVKELPDGLRVGMISVLAFMSTGGLSKCTPALAHSAGVAALDLGGSVDRRARATLKTMIQRAKADCDVLIVAPHWGIERQTKPTGYQVALGRAMIDAGADAVLGAHPHVLQTKELYKGKPIVYSMGNLISPRPASSAVFQLRFQGRKFVSWTEVPILNSGGKIVLAQKRKGPSRPKAGKGTGSRSG